VQRKGIATDVVREMSIDGSALGLRDVSEYNDCTRWTKLKERKVTDALCTRRKSRLAAGCKCVDQNFRPSEELHSQHRNFSPSRLRRSISATARATATGIGQ
jgi:hypothetical protein